MKCAHEEPVLSSSESIAAGEAVDILSKAQEVDTVTKDPIIAVDPNDEYLKTEDLSLRVAAEFCEGSQLSQNTIDIVHEAIARDGVCCLDGALEVEKLVSFKDEFLKSWERLDSRLTEAQVNRQKVFRFKELCSRKFGRFDVSGAACGDPKVFETAQNMAHKVLAPVWENILGEKAVVHMSGVIMNLGGSDDQAFHRDSAHLFDEELPPHALVIFIPLVPMTEENGPTHFKPGSHKYSRKVVAFKTLVSPH